jgi:hypothetical protein
VVTHTVPWWTDDAGYCNPIPGFDEGVHRPQGLDRLHVAVGDTVAFKYSTHHDIWSHSSLDALETCDHSRAVLIANRTEGGGCEHESDLECMAAARPYLLRAATAGTLYLSCSVGDHCANGQRLVVEVHGTRRPPPLEVVVPLWTDDAGYCKPLPGVFPIEQHHGTHGLRPHGLDRDGGGLEPISIAVGQTLVFRYSTHHDVWSHPTAESLANCDYSQATMLAGRTEGGGCTQDADLVCIDASVGFKITPTREQIGQKLYLSCSVGDHCSNGQSIVLSIVGDLHAAETMPPPPMPPLIPSFPSELANDGAGGPTFGGGLILGLVLGAAVAAGVAFYLRKRLPQSALPKEIVMSRSGSSEDPAHVSTVSASSGPSGSVA